MYTVAPGTQVVERAIRRSLPDQITIALLGLGHVGSAVARFALEPPSALDISFRVSGALVRDITRPRATGDRVLLAAEGDTLVDQCPDVVIEVLGGLEPARTLVLRALERGIPVVTANKSLLAEHGDELFAAAATSGVPLCYEAAVLAGVPFLGTFARRPLAASVSGFSGIVNGTTNFILTEMSGGRSYLDALAEAQRRGYAEPDPSNDVLGVDAAQKLAVLLRHFARFSVQPRQIETTGINRLSARDLRAAAALGAVIKPVATAAWTSDEVAAFTGPAFVPSSHVLARIDGVQNGILLTGAPGGDVLFAGPGAGPEATAATILDDVVEAIEQRMTPRPRAREVNVRAVTLAAPLTGWFVRLTGPSLPSGSEVSDLLGAYGVWARRISEDDRHDGLVSRWFITAPCSEGPLEASLAAIGAAARCATFRIRALPEARETQSQTLT